MSVARRVGAFLEVAAADLAAARALAELANRNAPYHCQQAAEKLTRAVLAARGVDATREHRIRELVALLPEGDQWRARLASLERLSPFATTYRYPTIAGRIPLEPPPSTVLADADEIAGLLELARTDLLSKR
jgi:HEPN domain-containing protein